jgi:hypothetical protein
VASIAGSEIKKVVLELGGSDPFIVMPSANLPRAAEVAAFARCLNNGQSCIAAKRFIVHDAAYDEFERLFTEQMSSKNVGDPMLDTTDIGPLASEQQRDDVEQLVADAVAKGAKALCGGAAPEGPGFYYEPTVLTGITSEMRSPTAPSSASARTPGPATSRNGRGSSGTWPPAWCSSMATSPRTRSCRSAVSRTPVSGGSCTTRASASSATSRPSGSARPPADAPAAPVLAAARPG